MKKNKSIKRINNEIKRIDKGIKTIGKEIETTGKEIKRASYISMISVLPYHHTCPFSVPYLSFHSTLPVLCTLVVLSTFPVPYLCDF